MRLALALDAGTTGVRTVAFSPAGEVLDSSYLEIAQHYPAPGLVEHDANEIAAAACATLADVARRCRERGDEVVALGIANQRETTVAFDLEDPHVAHRAIVWQDRRTAPTCERLADEGHLALVRERTGLVLDPYFSSTKMRWLVEHGVLDETRRPALGTIDAFLVWVLTGGPDGGTFATEPSNASRTSLFDIHRLVWDEEMGRLFGVPLHLLPEVRASAGSFGVVAASAVPELADVPIAAVLGDQQAALFGQACHSPGMVKATYGTGAFVLAHAGAEAPEVPAGLVGTVAWDLGPLGGTAYALEGSAFVAGAAIQWLRDELGVIERSSDLEGLAGSVADSGGVSFVPAFTGLGSPFWRSEARGAVLGLSHSTTRAHLARAVLEAQAFQVHAMVEAFAAAGVEITELRADGGAAAMDSMLQLQADLLGRRVARGTTLESTARGVASLAGLVAGLTGSLEDLGRTWRAERTFEPGDATAARAGYDQWRRAAERA